MVGTQPIKRLTISGLICGQSLTLTSFMEGAVRATSCKAGQLLISTELMSVSLSKSNSCNTGSPLTSRVSNCPYLAHNSSSLLHPWKSTWCKLSFPDKCSSCNAPLQGLRFSSSISISQRFIRLIRVFWLKSMD